MLIRLKEAATNQKVAINKRREDEAQTEQFFKTIKQKLGT